MPDKHVSQVLGTRFQRTLQHALVGALFIVLVTLACRRLQASFAVTSFFFLIVVLLQSLAGDFLSSILLSVSAVASLDYFFVDPRESFSIARGADGIALLAFLSTALVVTRLVSRVSAAAESARLERRRQARLYRLAEQLLTMSAGTELDSRVVERFRTVFGMRAACIFDGDAVAIHVAGKPEGDLAERTREAYLAGRDITDPGSEIWVRRLRAGDRIIGCIGFEGLEDAEATIDPLAALGSTFLERTRALRIASEAAAAAQAEVYRSAILDALAHEFKTPLATILAAAGGARAAGVLDSAQVEMMDIVETETERLGKLTSRLLRMARVEREQVRPRMRVIELVPLIEKLVDQYARRSPDRTISLLKPAEPLDVQADPELLQLAVSQLLENACKYSSPGSAVSLGLQDNGGVTEIRVTNSGSTIPAPDQHRIFERFYRGSTTGHTPGSGLGLYVARKIALAHGGALDVVPEDPLRQDVSFSLTIPTWRNESDHVVAAL